MKQLKSIYRYLGIALIIVFCFTAISTYFFLRSDNEVGPNLITAFVGVALSALITLLLLNGQTNAEEVKQKNVKKFEQKLSIYKEFLRALCNIVKDQKIEPGEEIMLQFQIAGASVLDLFGGTGQLGIEALSRGAKSATFVDAGDAACRLIHENLRRTNLSENAKVVKNQLV